MRTRRTALIAAFPCSTEVRKTSEFPPSFVARPWCDVSAAASNAKPAPRVTHGAARRQSLSLERRRSTPALRARSAALVVGYPPPTQGYYLGEMPLLSACAPVVRCASCGLQRKASVGCLARRRHTCAHSLSLEKMGSTQAGCAHAPCRASHAWSMPDSAASAKGLSPSARTRGEACQ